MSTQKPQPINEAIATIKKTCKCNFDSTVEVHFNMNLDPRKQDQLVRATTTLPNGTGKSKKVAVMASKKIKNADLELSESDISKIESGKIKPGVDFEVVIVEPDYMPKIAKIARILGPKGMMPNPKSGTVTPEVEEAVEQVKKGKVELKMEQNAPIIHTLIGKRSFSDDALLENFDAILKTLRQNKPQKAKQDWIKSCFISTSMSPSVQVDIETS